MKCDIVAIYVQGRPPVSGKLGFLEGFLPHHNVAPQTLTADQPRS